MEVATRVENSVGVMSLEFDTTYCTIKPVLNLTLSSKPSGNEYFPPSLRRKNE